MWHRCEALHRHAACCVLDCVLGSACPCAVLGVAAFVCLSLCPAVLSSGQGRAEQGSALPCCTAVCTCSHMRLTCSAAWQPPLPPCSGCGNTVNANHPHTLQQIVDSLKWWVEEYHVDGFRFDLGGWMHGWRAC